MGEMHSVVYKFDRKRQYVRVFSPARVRAVVLILHGMAEHGDRYKHFAKFLMSYGYAVYVPDHRQHGKSVFHDEYGIYDQDDTYENMLKDIDFIFKKVREKHPDADIYILGHSMGSMLARGYVQNFEPDIKGVILSGSPSIIGAKVHIMKVLTKLMTVFKNKRMDILNSITFLGNNRKVNNLRTNFDWISTDFKMVDKYVADKLCGFSYNASFYYQLARMIQDVNRPEKMEHFPLVPVLFISGEEDPVGEYGLGARDLVQKYEEYGNSFTTYIVPGMRHEVLNEVNRQYIYNLILDYLEDEKK